MNFLARSILRGDFVNHHSSALQPITFIYLHHVIFLVAWLVPNSVGKSAETWILSEHANKMAAAREGAVLQTECG